MKSSSWILFHTKQVTSRNEVFLGDLQSSGIDMISDDGGRKQSLKQKLIPYWDVITWEDFTVFNLRESYIGRVGGGKILLGTVSNGKFWR